MAGEAARGEAVSAHSHARAWAVAGLTISIAGGLVLFVASFLKWYKVDLDLGGVSLSVSANGWHASRSGYSALAAVIGLAVAIEATVLVIMSLTGQRSPSPPLMGWITAALGALALVLVLARLTQSVPSEVERGPGFLVAALGAAILTAGGVTTGVFATRTRDEEPLAPA